MASPAVATPLKNHRSIFSAKTAGGRMPLTPSPRTRNAGQINSFANSPATPAQQIDDEPLFANSFATRLQRSAARASARESPKSNIALANNSPRRIDQVESQFTLTGTGSHNKTGLKTRRDGLVKARPTKTTVRVDYHKVDRFIPTRNADDGAIGLSKLGNTQRPKSRCTDGSAILAASANAFNIGGRVAADDLTAAFDNLGLEEEDGENAPCTRPTPSSISYQSSLAVACGIDTNKRILSFKPAPPESSKPVDLRAQYNRPLKSAHPVSSQYRRKIPSAPERVLDAPDLEDDYYLNLLDWSTGNQVAIGLGRKVYVWSAETGGVDELFECEESTKITSVKWSNDGHYAAIGLGTGETRIWDIETKKKIRSLSGDGSRVGTLGWNNHILSTGSRTGLVVNNDVRIQQHQIAKLVSHESEVCGLEWRADGAQLATGGNDNLVSIWDARSLNAPKFTKANHRAAVKAISWCPWQPNLLATGGGAYDKQIHFWNTTTGARVNSIDTGSQVTSLRWSHQYKEIASTSGFPDNSISLWSYPTLIKTDEIPAHDTRILHSTLSPDGQMLATAAADESLKFWKIFEKKAGAASNASSSFSRAELKTTETIR